MAVLDKLMFWKKKDELDDLGKDFGADLSKDMPLGGDFTPSSQGFGEPWSQQGEQQPPFGQPSFGQQGQNSFGQGSFGNSFSQQQQPSPSFGQSSFSPPNLSQPGLSQPSYSQPSYASPAQPSYAQGSNSDYINAKSLEVISSKIDALRAAIDSMNARLANIERIAGQEEDTRRRRYY